jgi:hypothetical protein
MKRVFVKKWSYFVIFEEIFNEIIRFLQQFLALTKV